MIKKSPADALQEFMLKGGTVETVSESTVDAIDVKINSRTKLQVDPEVQSLHMTDSHQNDSDAPE